VEFTHGLNRGDRLVLGVALVLLVGLYATLWHTDGHGAEAVVMVDGKRWARLDLFQNQDLHVPGVRGRSHIRIRDGQVRFIDSPCPSKLCVHEGWLNRGGAQAVCLPNRVSVYIPGSDPRFDSINF
jgi:hypothetical protein